MAGGELENLFRRFASFGKSEIQNEIDNSKFHKFCKDCKLIDRQFTKTDADLIFTKAKPMGERRLTFDKFCYALTLIAEKKGLTNDQIVDQILSSRGPKVNATIAEPVRFHDDINTYTGVYLNGGPTNIDKHVFTLETLLDRSPADRRGTNLSATQQQHKSAYIYKGSGNRPYSRGESMNSTEMMMTSPRNFTTSRQGMLEPETQDRIQQLEQIIMEQQQIIQQQQQQQPVDKQSSSVSINSNTTGNNQNHGQEKIQQDTTEIEESKTETKVSSKSNKTANRKSIAPSTLRKKNRSTSDDDDDDDDDDQSEDGASTKSKATSKQNANSKKVTSNTTARKSMSYNLRKKQESETESEDETDSEDEKSSKTKAKSNIRASMAPIKSPTGAKKRVTMAPTAKKNSKSGNASDTDEDKSDSDSSENQKTSVKGGKKTVSIKESNRDKKKDKKKNSNDESDDTDDEKESKSTSQNETTTGSNVQGQGLLDAPDIHGLSLHDHPNYMNSNEANFQYEQQQFLEYQQQQEMLKTRSNRSNSYPSSQYDQSLLSRDLMHAVAEKFRAFATFGERVDVSIDSFKFVKLLSDAKLIDSRLNKQRADLIFYQSKAKGSKKMTYDEFRLKAIPYIAMTKGLPDVKIFEKIAECEGPKINTSSASEQLINSAGKVKQIQQSVGGNYSTSYSPRELQKNNNISRFKNVGNTSISPPTGIHKSLTNSIGYNTSNNFNTINNTSIKNGYSFASTMPYAQNTSYRTKKSIFERLNDPKTFTGVYAKRFEQSEFKGRINDDTINYNEARQYSGWTNTKKTDQKVEDLSQILIRR